MSILWFVTGAILNLIMIYLMVRENLDWGQVFGSLLLSVIGIPMFIVFTLACLLSWLSNIPVFTTKVGIGTWFRSNK